VSDLTHCFDLANKIEFTLAPVLHSFYIMNALNSQNHPKVFFLNCFFTKWEHSRMRNVILAFFLLMFFHVISLSGSTILGPQNDNCSQAFRLKNVSGWCSSPRQFTNEGAGPSKLGKAICFPGFDPEQEHDVWFVFNAIATTVNISIIGAVNPSPKGTLRNPQMALYQGTCQTGLKEVSCISDYKGNNIVDIFVSNLIVGATYYIRVDGRNGRTGSFQICINNYNPVPSPSSDCSTAVVLCDKSSFTVPSVVGTGRNKNELSVGYCLKEESSSSWYKWTCEKAGTLTFTLTSVNPGDDIDFALFLLPNGVNDCSVKIPLRCMASGENVNQDPMLWSRCTGPTGLKVGSIDLQEQEGCDKGDDNFLAPLQMEAGKSYLLLVNNYHNTGNGFNIVFGGTGTFSGPKAHFTVSNLNLSQNEVLNVKDASAFSGGIKKWEWNFGLNANPQSATTKGPHRVSYNSVGKKSISLSVETNNGCKVTKIRTISVSAPPSLPALPSGPQRDTQKVVAVRQDTQAFVLFPGSESTGQDILDSNSISENVSQIDTLNNSDYAKKRNTASGNIELLVKYVATIYFKADSSDLMKKDIETLEEVLKLMDKYSDHLVIVEGYTNSIPSDEYCNKLAAARADNVIAYLQGNGISEQRIVRKIYGRSRSSNSSGNLSVRKLFQKVELRIAMKDY
jgi:outer membrane protein OmpA-like peptidoglycan-associated protein